MTIWRCEYCGSEYNSIWALNACEQECEQADLHARQMLRGRKP